MVSALSPFGLSWSEVDPRLHPFDHSAALAEVSVLAPAQHAPSWPASKKWADKMSRALVERFGRWAVGWHWVSDEGELGGGPVKSLCRPQHLIVTPEKTVALVTEALCEWRAWLEKLAEHFDRYPLDSPSATERERTWNRAVEHLVILVVEGTEASDAWYEHCELVLEWFLTYWGLDAKEAEKHVRLAIRDDFKSWAEPDRQTVQNVAQRLTASLWKKEDG